MGDILFTPATLILSETTNISSEGEAVHVNECGVVTLVLLQGAMLVQTSQETPCPRPHINMQIICK